MIIHFTLVYQWDRVTGAAEGGAQPPNFHDKLIFMQAICVQASKNGYENKADELI